MVLSSDGEVELEELWRNSFDRIISDWHMPKMDGLNFLRL
jgi:CheY-like chemotaxis protein